MHAFFALLWVMDVHHVYGDLENLFEYGLLVDFGICVKFKCCPDITLDFFSTLKKDYSYRDKVIVESK